MLEPTLCPRKDNQIIREQKAIHTHTFKETIAIQKIFVGQGTQDFLFQVSYKNGEKQWG
jgi:hypothetical protein